MYIGDFLHGASVRGWLFVADLFTGQIQELLIGSQSDPLGLFVKGMGQDRDGDGICPGQFCPWSLWHSRRRAEGGWLGAESVACSCDQCVEACNASSAWLTSKRVVKSLPVGAKTSGNCALGACLCCWLPAVVRQKNPHPLYMFRAFCHNPTYTRWPIIIRAGGQGESRCAEVYPVTAVFFRVSLGLNGGFSRRYYDAFGRHTGPQ